MNEEEINSIRDQIILKSADQNIFSTLSYKQKLIGAVDLLVSFAVRSGVEVFFDLENNYLWREAEYALLHFNAPISASKFNIILKQIKKGKNANRIFKGLQDSLVITEFDQLQNSIQKFIQKSPEVAIL